ncbi:MAG: ABC transporter substrate-binding protein [Oscillospiraceae bacterium]|jgi:peptide/nickel transport system substrate-binding protein|nr:ABC transporter substrate-binding protein [Oscillospiraceae bacterium]
MKEHKKLAGVTSIALAACMLLSACGNNGGTASSAATGTASSAASSATASGTSTTGGASDNGKLIAATDPSKLPAAASARKDTLVIGAATLGGDFNGLWCENLDDQYVAGSTYSALSSNDSKGEIIDGTASLAISPDGLTYTYKLKADKFSDGTPVTAKDYVNNLNVLYDKSYDGPADNTKIKIVGVDDYKSGKAKTISGVTTPDDKTLVIKLSARNSSAKYFLGSTYPISTAKYGSLIKQGNMSGIKSLKMINWVGNGAYTLTSYKEGQNATLTSNPNYYKGAPKIKTLIFKAVAEGAEMQALSTGDVDIEPDIVCSQDQISVGQASKFINMWVQPTLGYGFVGINCKNPLFSDIKVRQALLYALDRKALIKSVYGDYASELNCNQAKISWVYPGTGLNTYDYDMTKAANLLKEAGWTKGSDGKLTKDGKKFKFMFSASKGNAVTDTMIPMMIDAYKKLGIDMQAEYVDGATLFKKHSKMNYDMTFMAWALTADPDDSPIYTSKGAQNYSGFGDPEIDKAYAAALSATTKDEVKDNFAKAYQTINKDLPCWFIYQRSDCIGYNSRVKNFKSTPYEGFLSNIEELEVG